MQAVDFCNDNDHVMIVVAFNNRDIPFITDMITNKVDSDIEPGMGITVNKNGPAARRGGCLGRPHTTPQMPHLTIE